MGDASDRDRRSDPPARLDAPVRFDAKDRPLARDVRRLGALLGELLRELAPAGVFETVEAARLAARRRRRGDPAAGAELTRLVGAQEPALALEVVRAFSAYFGVVNTAEQVHRLRRRRDWRRERERTGRPQPASLAAAAAALAARGTSVEDVEAALARLVVEPVFTAHPTESVRRTLLKKEQRLARALVARFAAEDLDPTELRELDEGVALEIASAWQTEEELPAKPTVAEEVEHVLFFLSEVLYAVVPEVHAELERALAAAYGREVPIRRPVLRFASWVGGDMDGNPAVGAETIRATLARHEELAVRRYREELRGLHEHLSQSTSRVAVDPRVLARVADYAARLPEDAARVPARYRDMPYRRLLWLMEARLARKARGAAEGYGRPAELAADLALVAESLARHRGARAGLALVRRALLRVEVFGFHLAALDARQDAAVHRRVVGALLDDPDFAERPALERAARLAAELAQPAAEFAQPATELAQPAASLAVPAGESGPSGAERLARVADPQRRAEAEQTLAVFAALAEARERYGEAALGPFVVSMAQGPDDALAVLWLARLAGLVEPGAEVGSAPRVPLDVAPLFETVDDLAAGPDVLRALCAEPVWAAHLAARGRRQVVMLGYSDSNKDGGIAASRVALDRAQERLVAVAQEADVELVLFHGRGGSTSRGGSKPRAAVLAAPPGALGGHLRTTEQGEIVGAKYGLRGIAERTLEVSLGALLERCAGDRARSASDAEREIADTLAAASRAHYRALVHEEPDFPALFRGMTPIDVIERLPIGSRPARRRSMRGVEDLRAIPWVFAWTQCRAALPGWYGVGAGLTAAIEAHGLAAVRRAAREWPFLGVLFADVEMVLAKSDLDVAARYAELAGEVGARLFPRLSAEHERATALVLEVGRARELLERDPVLARAIRLRNPYVDPLSFVQVDLLARWRAGGRADEGLERVLLQTVRGIARGLRNTG